MLIIEAKPIEYHINYLGSGSFALVRLFVGLTRFFNDSGVRFVWLEDSLSMYQYLVYIA